LSLRWPPGTVNESAGRTPCHFGVRIFPETNEAEQPKHLAGTLQNGWPATRPAQFSAVSKTAAHATLEEVV
jgi:hypothetical protein